MRGNKAFIDSQRAADRVSNARAEEILAKSPTARGYYEAIMSRVPGWKAAGLDPPGSKEFQVGERVKIKMPLMTVVAKCPPSKTGVVMRIDGAYIKVRPSRWPSDAPADAGIEFYPNELLRFHKNVRRTQTERAVDRLIDTAANGSASDRVRNKRAAGKRRGSGGKVQSNVKRPRARSGAARR